MKFIISVVFLLVISACSGTKWKSAKTISTTRNISSTKSLIPQGLIDELPSKFSSWQDNIVKYEIPPNPMIRYNMKEEHGSHGFFSPKGNSTQDIAQGCVSEFGGTLERAYISFNNEYYLLRYGAPYLAKTGKNYCKSGDLMILSAKQVHNLTKIKNGSAFDAIDRDTLPEMLHWYGTNSDLSKYKVPLSPMLKYDQDLNNQDIDDPALKKIKDRRRSFSSTYVRYCTPALLGTLQKIYYTLIPIFGHYLLRYEAPNDGDKGRFSCKSGDLIILSWEQTHALKILSK